MGPVVRVAGCVFIIYITYLAQPGTSLFSWHPFLMTLAFTGLMTEAVVMFSKYGLGSGRLHSTKVTGHWALLAAAATAHGLGYAAIYYTKEGKNKPHLTTWHGLLGLITSVLFWIQLSAGVFSKYPKLLQSFVSLRDLRAGHSLSGSVTFALGMVTLCLGLCSAWFNTNAAPWSFYAGLTFHLLLLFVVCKRHIQKYIWAK